MFGYWKGKKPAETAAVFRDTGRDYVRYHTLTADLIQNAARKARGLGHSYVGSVHLLLAMAWEPGGPGMVLRQLDHWREAGFDLVFVSNAAPPEHDWGRVGERAVLKVDTRRLHLFDVASGLALD